MKRKYVAVNYDIETQKNLRNWCKENGYDLAIDYNGNIKDPNDFVFHTTIIYSKNEFDGIHNSIIDIKKIEVKPIKFDLFGDNKDIPVLLVESEELIQVHKWLESIGLQDYWSEFCPHISLSYAKNTGIDKSLPNFKLYYDTIVIEDLDDEV